MPSRVASLLAAAVLFAATAAAAQPQRIVSINLCTDQILLALEPGARLAAVSPLAADPGLSAEWRRARGVPAAQPTVEHVLRHDPDLVVAGQFGHTRVVRHLEAAGVAVLRVPEASSFAEVRAAYIAVGDAVGLPERGRALAAAVDGELGQAHSARAATALILSPGLMVHGDAMLGGAVLAHAGYANARGDATYLTLEGLAAAPPDTVFVALGDPPAPSRAARLLAHPALAGLDVRRVPPAALLCGGLETARLARALAASAGGTR